MSHPWIIDDKISAAIINKADKHEVFAVSSSVDSLERTVRSLSTEVAGLRSELEATKDTMRRLIDEVTTLVERSPL